MLLDPQLLQVAMSGCEKWKRTDILYKVLKLAQTHKIELDTGTTSSLFTGLAQGLYDIFYTLYV